MGRLTKRKVDRIRAMWEEGYTQKEIAAEVGCSPATVRKYVKGEGGLLGPQELEELVTRVVGHIDNMDYLLGQVIPRAKFYCYECSEFCVIAFKEYTKGRQALACGTCGHIFLDLYELMSTPSNPHP